jgi:hypothetical protein
MLSVVMQSVIMLSVIMLSVVMLSVILLSVILLSVIMLSVIMRSVTMLSVILLSVIMQSVVMLSVVMLSAVAQFENPMFQWSWEILWFFSMFLTANIKPDWLFFQGTNILSKLASLFETKKPNKPKCLSMASLSSLDFVQTMLRANTWKVLHQGRLWDHSQILD